MQLTRTTRSELLSGKYEGNRSYVRYGEGSEVVGFVQFVPKDDVFVKELIHN